MAKLRKRRSMLTGKKSWGIVSNRRANRIDGCALIPFAILIILGFWLLNVVPDWWAANVTPVIDGILEFFHLG